jgi:hypothetical protein
MGQAGQPAAQQLVDLLGPELFTDGLQPFRIGTGSEAVVQRLVTSLLLELTLGILVTIQAQLGGEGKIGTKLQEERAEVLIHAIPVVVVDHGRGTNDPRIALTGLGVASLFGSEDGSLFLRFAKEHHALSLIEVAELFGHHLLLALSFLEQDQRDLVLLGKAFGGSDEALGHGTHEGRGSNGLSPMAVKKLHHSAFVLQGGHVEIQVHPVNAFKLEGDMILENVSDAV